MEHWQSASFSHNILIVLLIPDGFGMRSATSEVQTVCLQYVTTPLQNRKMADTFSVFQIQRCDTWTASVPLLPAL